MMTQGSRESAIELAARWVCGCRFVRVNGKTYSEACAEHVDS